MCFGAKVIVSGEKHVVSNCAITIPTKKHQPPPPSSRSFCGQTCQGLSFCRFFFCLKVPSIKPMDRWRCFPYRTSWEVQHLGPCRRVRWEDARMMIRVLNLSPYQASPGIITKTIAMVMLLEFWQNPWAPIGLWTFKPKILASKFFRYRNHGDFCGIFLWNLFFEVHHP